jgi:alpha-glucosidase
VIVVANTGTQPVALPDGEVLLASDDVSSGGLPGDTTAWLCA